MVGRLAAGVAHDVDGLLTMSLGYVEMLLRRPDADGSVAKQVSELRAGLLRAAELNRKLLVLGRRQVDPPQLLDVAELVRGIDGWLRRLLGSDVEVEVALPSESWLVMIDRAGLEHVLMSLVSNAHDAMAGRGRLRLEVANEETSDGPRVCISIRDSGVGMDEATMMRAFEPFFTTKPAGQGKGLGLAIALDIVTECGGRMTVESSPGVGTTFEVLLPRATMAR
jgi:signal transduction histidine kinase